MKTIIKSLACLTVIALNGPTAIAGPEFFDIYGHATPSWAQWARKPIDVRVLLKSKVKADNGSAVSVKFDTTSFDSTGVSCNTEAVWGPGIALLQPYRSVTISVTGAALNTITLELTPQHLMSLQISRAGGSPLRDKVKLFINNVETNQVTGNNTNCGPYSTNWTVELRPDNDRDRASSVRSKVGRDDERDVADNAAPGDGTWLAIGPGRSQISNDISMKWSVGLGRLLNGKSAGRIHFMEHGLKANTYTPLSLVFAQPFPLTNSSDPMTAQLQVLNNNLITNQAVIRQIKAPQGIADVRWDTNCLNGYEIHFYPPSAIGRKGSVPNFYNFCG